MFTRKWIWALALLALFTLESCDDDDTPEAENEEEVIDQVILVFQPTGGSERVTINSTDPDGEGVADFNRPTIVLSANETYTLSIVLNNTIEEESITEAIEEEDEEHMFFFGFTSGLFVSPEGDGNIGAGNRDDPMNYTDEDEMGYPVGLSTVWVTAGSGSGEFTVVLKHQPDGQKTASSSSTDGETDIALTWDIVIQ